MNAFLEIYLSSFWSWSGITIGAAVAMIGVSHMVGAIRDR